MAVELNPSVKAPQTMGAALDQFTKLAGDSTKAKEVLGKALEVLAGANVKITRTEDTTATGTGEKKTTGATNVPSLDNPDDVKQIQENLEKLIAYLKLDNDERQSEMAKERIETNKASLEKEHANRKDKIQETLDKIKEAEETRKAQRVFGWLMAALAVVVAVVACVATGGLAAGPVIGAVIAVGMQVMSETGAMDKITDALASGLEKMGMNKEAAKIVAQVAICVAALAASLGAGFGSAGAIAETMKDVATLIRVATTAIGVVSLGVNGVGLYNNFQAGTAQADLTETEKFIAILQRRLEESEEELKKILEAIQNGIAQIAQLLDSATATSDDIAQHIGQMA